MNMNIVEILKDCPKGTKLYSTLLGDIFLERVNMDINEEYSIVVKTCKGGLERFTSEGLYYICFQNTECALFPSKENRDWSTFKVPKKEYEFKPFDKVLVRDSYNTNWHCEIFSSKDGNILYPYKCISSVYAQCIPYEGNEHLLGTSNPA